MKACADMRGQRIRWIGQVLKRLSEPEKGQRDTTGSFLLSGAGRNGMKRGGLLCGDEDTRDSD